MDKEKTEQQKKIELFNQSKEAAKLIDGFLQCLDKELNFGAVNLALILLGAIYAEGSGHISKTEFIKQSSEFWDYAEAENQNNKAEKS